MFKRGYYSRRSILTLAASSVLLAAAVPMKPRPDPMARKPEVEARLPRDTLVFFGSQPGMETLDKSASGLGNPFATAFIGALSQPDVPIEAFAEELFEATRYESMGIQVVDRPSRLEPAGLKLFPTRKEGRRSALVLVISDYGNSRQLPSLNGARYDAGRVVTALINAGYETTLLLDGSTPYLLSALDEFSRESQGADVSLIYVTGHGVEINYDTRLLTTQFDSGTFADDFDRGSIGLSRIARAAKARTANLVFYAGCRNNPFDL